MKIARIDTFRKAEKLRQQALDIINANPGITGQAVMAALGWESAAQAANHRFKWMIANGELRREATHKSRHSYRYWAMVETTRSAEEYYAESAELRRQSVIATCAKRNLEPRVSVNKPTNDGRYVHVPGLAIPNQGGQGYAAPRMGTYLEVVA